MQINAGLIVLFVLVTAMPASSIELMELSSKAKVGIAGDKNTELIVSPSDLNVDRNSRESVIDFYLDFYLPGESAVLEFDGSVATCTPGTNNESYHQATVDRINYYRAMAGVPADIALHPILNAMSQEAALMMAAAGTLTHQPDTGFPCYSKDGDTAAGKSNLVLGATGPKAIDAYIADFGDNNTAVGHRLAVLNPESSLMGSGNVLGGEGGTYSNALWKSQSTVGILPFSEAPLDPFGTFFGCFSILGVPTSQIVAWPPDGFVPKPLISMLDGRWSYSHPGAMFSSATVTVAVNDVQQSVEIYEQARVGTLVWEVRMTPDVVVSSPGPDLTFTVTISNFRLGLENSSISYRITAVDVPNAESLLDGKLDENIELNSAVLDDPYTAALESSAEAANPIRDIHGSLLVLAATLTVLAQWRFRV